VDIRLTSGRRRRGGWAGGLALIALFWCAQMVGLSHGISHLGRDRAVPHGLVCTDCVVSADAGAAPLAVLSSLSLAPLHALSEPIPAAEPVMLRLPVAHRSRAPPATPV
jgi:hypothetical protein